jgi:hypothetical protein
VPPASPYGVVFLILRTLLFALPSKYVHAAFGGGGPRWQPLNVAGRHDPMARRQSESVLAGGMVTAVETCGWTAAMPGPRLGGAGGGGGGIFGFPTAMNQNYVISVRIIIFGLFHI